MTGPTPLQATPAPGALTVWALWVGVFVSTLLAVLLSVRVVGGYRRTGSTHLLALGVGLLLLIPVPKLLNIALTTLVVPDSPVVVGIAMAVCRLGGLGTILYAIYAN